MPEIGIRALKQNASAVVAQVAAGETITITDRGRPVARMTPLRPSAVRQLIDAGQARPARRRLAEVPRPLPGPSPSVALSDMRDDERY